MNNSNETNISANMTEIEEIDKTLYRTLAQVFLDLILDHIIYPQA